MLFLRYSVLSFRPIQSNIYNLEIQGSGIWSADRACFASFQATEIGNGVKSFTAFPFVKINIKGQQNLRDWSCLLTLFRANIENIAFTLCLLTLALIYLVTLRQLCRKSMRGCYVFFFFLANSSSVYTNTSSASCSWNLTQCCLFTSSQVDFVLFRHESQ